MVLVDPSQMYVKTTPVPDPLSDSVLSLDNEMKQILDNTSTPIHDKVVAYQQILQKYLNRVDQSTQREYSKLPNSLPTATTPPIDEKLFKMEKRILDSLPQTLQKKGGLLLDYLKDVCKTSTF